MGALTPESPATVDASRPFRSVKEAVAIFGQRILPRDMHTSPKHPPDFPTPPRITRSSSQNKTPPHSSETPESPNKSPNPNFTSEEQLSPSPEIKETPAKSPTNIGKEIVESSFTNAPTPSYHTQTSELASPNNVVHGNDLVMMLMVLKKLEAEVQDTKMELKLLKERESETEVAVASLNAELHKNMSKIAKAEAAEAGERSRALFLEGGKRNEEEEESSRRDMIVKNMDSPTLAKILSISDYDGYFAEGKKGKKNNKNMMMMMKKKKPIIPLVTDIFPWKKRSSW